MEGKDGNWKLKVQCQPLVYVCCVIFAWDPINVCRTGSYEIKNTFPIDNSQT